MLSMAVAVIVPFISEGVNQYNVTNYNEAELQAYNKLDAIYNQTKDIEESATGISDKQGALSILDGFFSDAYTTMKLSFSSFGLIGDTLDIAANQTSSVLGQNGKIFRKGIGSIILIVLVLGVLISSIVKREL